MEQYDAYAVALEFASTQRFREAREKLKSLLEVTPGHVDALLLLAKVEYYLGNSSTSRGCFETALAYDPHNITAYFGLQFYRERRMVRRLAAGVSMILLSILVAAGVLSIRMESAVGKTREAVVDELNAARRELSRFANDVEELQRAAFAERERLRGELAGVADVRNEVEKLIRDVNGLAERIEGLAKRLDKQPPTDR